jgi:hypothetical protein
MSKREAISKLRICLAYLFDTRYRGADAQAFGKAQGFADGYMQALADMQLIDDREMLAVVNEERRRAADRADGRLAASRMPPAPPVTTYA